MALIGHDAAVAVMIDPPDAILVEAGDLVDPEENLIADPERCSRRSAPIAVPIRKYLSSRPKVNQCIAKNVSKVIGNPGIKTQETYTVT